MNLLQIILLAVQLFLIFFLLLPFFNLFFSLLVPRQKLKKNFDKKYDFAAVITAYKDINVAIPCVDSILKQKYENYIIYLVADQCDVSNLNFDSDKVVILNPSEKLGSKVKSINLAIVNFKRKHEAIIVFDPDNLAHPQFIQIINYN